MEKVFVTHSTEETKALAAKVMSLLKMRDIVLLTGDLGAGKTTFVGGALAYLGYEGHVISPTFNILKCYFEVTPHVYHIDAYRLEDQNIDLGLEEFIEGDGVCFIEWPKFIDEIIPSKRLYINLKRVDDNIREISISSEHPKYKDLLEAI